MQFCVETGFSRLHGGVCQPQGAGLVKSSWLLEVVGVGLRFGQLHVQTRPVPGLLSKTAHVGWASTYGNSC